MSINLLAIGDTTIDTFLRLENDEAQVICSLNKEEYQLCLHYADKIPVAERHETLGGNAANAATTGARLGIATALWTIMGDDWVARNAKQQFQNEGIAPDYFQIDNQIHSDQSTVINYQGERTILQYGDRKNYQMPNFAPADWVYLTSLGDGTEIVMDSLSAWLGRNPSSKLVYQPGGRQLRLGVETSRSILEKTEIIFMNKEEATDYVKTQNSKLKTQNDGVVSPQIDIKYLLHGLLSLGPKIAVITDGSEGSYASDGKTVWKQGIDNTIPVIERTGAGDAYASAFTVAIIKGKDIPEAMCWGALNSESVIQKIGPQAGILTLNELEKLRAEGRPKTEITSGAG